MKSASIRRVAAAGLVTVLAVGAAIPAWSAPPRAKRDARTARPEAIQSIDNQRRIDVNQLNMYVTNYGSFAWDLATGNSGLIYPRGTNKTAVFASGLWLGARVAGATRVTVAEYSQEYGPGSILPSGEPDDARKRDYLVYKVSRFTGPEDTAHVDRSVAELGADPLADPLVHHSWSEYMHGAAPYGAPVRTYRLPNTLTPDPGDSVDIDGPDVSGDQMLWAVYNDANAALHSNSAGNSTPLGVEIQQTTFGFNRQGALGSTLFLQFKIIHKGTEELEDMFVSLWADPDLGGAADDLVGSDTTLSLGYVYNATNNDQLYGINPPAVGYDFFKGPSTPGGVLGLTSFNKYINGTDPHDPNDTYCYMQGALPAASPGDPCTPLVDHLGAVTRYFHAGDPVTGTGWLDSSPADRRFLLSAGPFEMSPGDTQTVVAAIIIARGSDRLSSISGLRFFDVSAQEAFDRNFQLKSPPPQPRVSVDVDGNSVRLCWDAASRLNYNEPGYAFEGYTVYQGASVAGPWTRLATFDEVNNVLVVRDTVFDLTTGQLITDYPVAFGGDNGIAFCYQTNTDAVRGVALREGTEYYFAVTSYSTSTTERDAVLENAQQVIRVIPQSPPLGTDPSTATVASMVHLRVDPDIPPATDEIRAETVDPTAVRAYCYRVFFTDLAPPFPIVEGDTARVAWNLVNLTTGDTLLVDQINKTGNPDYRVFDGLQIKVVGAYEPAFQTADYRDLEAAHGTALEGVNFGLPFFGGGAGAGNGFYTSTLNPVDHPDSFTTVQFRFSSTETQKAYRFLRLEKASDGAPPPQSRGLIYAGFVDVPFTVWDATNEVQLDAVYVERGLTDDAGLLLSIGEQPATHDSTWGPDDSDLGGREYLFALRSPYSDTPKPAYQVNGSAGSLPLLPSLYVLWAKLVDGGVIDPGDQFEFVWANPATPNDIYEFCTTPLVRSNTALIASGLERIRVVPNPYRMRSRYEVNQFNRVVRFINMPERATVRIFTLSGQLIRTLEKTDPTNAILQWDLLTENGLPLASGVYIYHVESPGGETFGRMIVFMEKERLNTF